MRATERSLRFPAALLAVLLIAATVLVVLLGVQAFSANVYHLQQTEDVLRDYAALAGDEALRRVASEIGYYGFRPAVNSLREAAARHPGVPDLQQLRAEVGEQAERALALADAVFVYDQRLDRLQGVPSERVPQALVEHLRESEDGGRGFISVAVGLESETQQFVFAPVDGDWASGEVMVGFRVDHAVLRQRCAQAIERGALLPPALGEGDLDNSVLFLSVRDREGRVLAGQGQDYAAGLMVERRPPADYQTVIDGLHVRVAIDPKAAHRLVIGGLPRSRLPFLLTLFALTIGLLVAASFLLRRERALIQLRREFVARVSHELRTPLAQIRMFSETLRLGRVRSDAEQQRYFEILDRESQRLSALVENVLQFSRAESGNLQLEPRATAIEPIFQRLIDEMDLSIAASGGTIETEVEPNAHALLDPDAMHQALLNLVDNAAKYGPDKQRILLTGRTRGDSVRITVEDRGPGIPKSERENVWRPFHRVPDSHQSGTGIGLAVVRELIEEQGGRCWIEPRERQGTRVVLDLPRAQGAPNHSSKTLREDGQ